MRLVRIFEILSVLGRSRGGREIPPCKKSRTGVHHWIWIRRDKDGVESAVNVCRACGQTRF